MARKAEPARGVDAPSATEFHVLLVLSRGALYGYAIMKAVEEESGGISGRRSGHCTGCCRGCCPRGSSRRRMHPLIHTNRIPDGTGGSIA